MYEKAEFVHFASLDLDRPTGMMRIGKSPEDYATLMWEVEDEADSHLVKVVKLYVNRRLDPLLQAFQMYEALTERAAAFNAFPHRVEIHHMGDLQMHTDALFDYHCELVGLLAQLESSHSEKVLTGVSLKIKPGGHYSEAPQAWIEEQERRHQRERQAWEEREAQELIRQAEEKKQAVTPKKQIKGIGMKIPHPGTSQVITFGQEYRVDELGRKILELKVNVEGRDIGSFTYCVIEEEKAMRVKIWLPDFGERLRHHSHLLMAVRHIKLALWLVFLRVENNAYFIDAERLKEIHFKGGSARDCPILGTVLSSYSGNWLADIRANLPNVKLIACPWGDGPSEFDTVFQRLS